MYGRRGWICELCNNFNFDSRKKCNRCHSDKMQKKIAEYLIELNNQNILDKYFWTCKYCGNNNIFFRLICDRCQAKKVLLKY